MFGFAEPFGFGFAEPFEGQEVNLANAIASLLQDVAVSLAQPADSSPTP